MLELEIDLGRCLVLNEEDELMDTWQYNGFDSAWSPGGANHEGLEENCIWSKSNANLNRRITILGCIPVSAVDFNRHFLVHNGWLSSKHGVQPPIPIGSQAEIRGLRQREAAPTLAPPALGPGRYAASSSRAALGLTIVEVKSPTRRGGRREQHVIL